jgi:hypothetical protein
MTETTRPAVKAYVLLGGVMDGIGPVPASWGHGPVGSYGLEGLGENLAALPDVTVVIKDWGQWHDLVDMIAADKDHDKVAVIGFSGGASRATWLANTSYQGKAWLGIDLLVGYDPSPKWQVLPLHGNVAKAICYFNTSPMMPSLVGMLGGGQYSAAASFPCNSILTRTVSEQHLAVQFNPQLHAATIQAVKDLQAA